MASIYEKDKACAAPRCTNTMTGSDLPRFCAEHNDLNKLERQQAAGQVNAAAVKDWEARR